MPDPRLISAVPVLCVLACTASHPNDHGKPDQLVLADDLEAAPVARPPSTPPANASATSTGADPSGETGLIGHGGGSTSRVERRPNRNTRIPTIRLARPEVDGALDEAVLRRTVNANLRDVRRCYDAQIVRDPNARGRITIAFEIDGKGKVAASTVQASTMKDNVPGDCIAAAVTGWKFPRPRTGTVKVVYPFVLEPG